MPIEPRNDIRTDSRRLDRAWIGNCVAAGLSQSFFEQLEATSIHGTVLQMDFFARKFLDRVVAGQEPERDEYNQEVERQVDDFCAFINMHNMGERTDTASWNDIRPECIGDDTRTRLRQWSRRLPRKNDFEPLAGGAPHVEEQLYFPVLVGLGLLSRNLAKSEMRANPKLRSLARKSIRELDSKHRREVLRCDGHGKFLQSACAKRFEHESGDGKA